MCLPQKSFLIMKEIELLWNKNATEKSKKMTPYQRYDFRRGASLQKMNSPYKVLYVSSATYLCSLVVKNSKALYYVNDEIKIPLQGFIAESKTYFYDTTNENEAYFLCSCLNSPIIDSLIKPLQTRGLWGARDIHKRPLLFPIPKFDDKNPLHVKLAVLGKESHKKIMENKHQFIEFGVSHARQIVKKLLINELQEIDVITRKLLLPKENH